MAEKRGYTVQELQEILGVSRPTVYTLLKRNGRILSVILSIEESGVYDLLIRENIETVTVDYWKRVPKSAFHQWYKGQFRYMTQEDRKAVEDLYETRSPD